MGVPLSAQFVVTPALRLLKTTYLCLKPISGIVDQCVMAALPSGFTDKVLCLACEELGMHMSTQDALLARREHWQDLINLLSLVVSGVLQMSGTANHKPLCKALLGHGALEAGRMSVLAYCSEALQIADGATLACANLQRLMRCYRSLSFNHLQADQSSEAQHAPAEHASADNTNRACNHLAAHQLAGSSSSVTSGYDESPVAPRVKVTDVQLIAALRKHSWRNRSSMVENTKTMYYILMAEDIVREQSNKLLNQADKAEASLGIAHHCSIQVLHRMRAEKQTMDIAGCSDLSTARDTELGILHLQKLMESSSTRWPLWERPGAW